MRDIQINLDEIEETSAIETEQVDEAVVINVKDTCFVHGNNLLQKENHKTKYQKPEHKQFLKEIREKYDQWKKANIELKGPLKQQDKNDNAIIAQRVELLNEYKDFLDQEHYATAFDSRSNLHSSVLEEFMYFLFKDVVADISLNAHIGKTHSFKDIFFRPNSFANMLKNPSAVIEIKDHDFAIGINVESSFKPKGQEEIILQNWDLPAIAVECKTYLDKTMLQDVSTAAEQIKNKNPNARYVVVAEWLKLTESINLKKYKIDQIYILRKQKNTDREYRYDESYQKNPIYADVVEKIFNDIRDFLTEDWDSSILSGLNKGYLI